MDAGVVSKVAGLVFIVTSMASIGLSVRPRDVGAQFGRAGLVARSLLANFVLVPLIAWGLTRLLPMAHGYEIGLMLVSGAAGAPLLPKITEMARGSVPFAVALMILLVVGSILFLPLVMPRVLTDLDPDAWRIARPLLVLVALPLVAGMVVRARLDAFARRVAPTLHKISEVFLLVFVAVVVLTHLKDLWGVLGSGAIAAAALFAVLSGAVAYALGGPETGTRRALALGTAQRNIAAALVTAGDSFKDKPDVVVMILVTDVVALAVLFGAVKFFRKSAPPEGREAAPVSEGASP